MVKAHDRDRTEYFEGVRMISFCSLKPYLEKGTTIDEFWPLASDVDGVVPTSAEWLKEMSERAKQMAEIYSKNNLNAGRVD